MYVYTPGQWALLFFFYCFCGWVWESCYVSARQRQWVNRGFLHGPLLPIYGSGAIIILFVTLPAADNLWLVYVLGMLAATLLEYVVETVQSAERARLLRACMAELHEDYREALFLVYFEGLSHAETAAVMGKREKQVADLIYRGKIALRKQLEQEGITDAYNG